MLGSLTSPNILAWGCEALHRIDALFGGRSWLVPIFTASDMELLNTAGLDSLMLNWTNTLGMQIFFPLTILGLAACKCGRSNASARDL